MVDGLSSGSPAGGLLRLGGRVRLDGLWLGPAAAALAGILAVGARLWSVQALVLLLLADLGWGNIWWATAGTDWATMRERWNAWLLSGGAGSSRVNAAGVLPYTQADSPAGRLARWWSDLRAWHRAELWPARGPQLGAILIGVPLALALGAALGPPLLLMTLGVVAISQMALFWGPADGYASPAAQATVEIGLPWLAGGVMLDRLSGGVLAVGVGLLLAYAGLALVGRSKAGGAWLALGHGVIVLTLAVLRQPLGAAAVGALYCSQLALLPWCPAGLEGRTALRLAQWPFLAVMAIAAAVL
jgi:hypothetical protein